MVVKIALENQKKEGNQHRYINGLSLILLFRSNKYGVKPFQEGSLIYPLIAPPLP